MPEATKKIGALEVPANTEVAELVGLRAARLILGLKSLTNVRARELGLPEHYARNKAGRRVCAYRTADVIALYERGLPRRAPTRRTHYCAGHLIEPVGRSQWKVGSEVFARLSHAESHAETLRYRKELAAVEAQEARVAGLVCLDEDTGRTNRTVLHALMEAGERVFLERDLGQADADFYDWWVTPELAAQLALSTSTTA